MDRQQFLDEITAIDVQIGRLRDRTKNVERDIAMRHVPADSENDRQECARYADEIRRLVEQKRVLRVRISET